MSYGQETYPDPEIAAEQGERVPAPAYKEPAVDPDIFEYTSDKKIDECLEDVKTHLLGLLMEYKNFRKQYVEPVWDETYAAYHGLMPGSNEPYQSFYPMKEIFRQVEVLKPLLAAQLLPSDRLFQYQPWSGADDFEETENAQAATGIVHYHIRKFRIAKELLRWMDNSIVWGNSYLVYGWREFRSSKRKIKHVVVKEKDGPARKSWKRETVEFYDPGPCVQWLNHWSVYADPNEEDIEDSPAVFVVEKVSTEYLKSMVAEGILDEKRVERGVERGTTAGKDDFESDYQDGPDQQPERYARPDQTKINPEGMHRLVTAYTNQGFVYRILNNCEVVQAQRNFVPHAPIVMLKNYPQPGQHYGLGEPGILLWEQALLNDSASMLMDAAHLTMNPMYKVHERSVKHFDSIVVKPGARIPLEDMDDLDPMPVTPQVNGLMSLIDFQSRHMERETGVTQELSGQTQHRTSTGLARLQDAARARLDHKIRWFVPEFERLYRALYALEADNLDEEVAVKIEGEAGRTLVKTFDPSVFMDDVDVQVSLPPEMPAPAERMQKAIQLFQVMNGNPMVRQDMAVLKLLEGFGEKHPRRFMTDHMDERITAIRENQDFAATGWIGDPLPQDNHQLHLLDHTAFMQSLQFMTMAPEAQAQFRRHYNLHMAAVNPQQPLQVDESNNLVLSAGGQPGDTGAMPADMAGSMQAEAQFGNAATGAAQQGQLANPAAGPDTAGGMV